MIGADYINHFLLRKETREGEVAWLTGFGWVLSGPTATAEVSEKQQEIVPVSSVHVVTEWLWEFEEPSKIAVCKSFPVFPLTYEHGRC